MTDTQQKLADYVQNGSEEAFRELVSQYVDLVYSAAVRLVDGDTHLAEDVTQTVFADLARQARALAREVMLGGWLHRHTCFVAANTLRSERRRLARERQAMEMNAPEDHSAANLAQVAPLLDDAINQLGAEDRTAIVLRFFEQHDFRTVGEALGSNEDAARKRVDRALGKLETLLKRRGVALSTTALATALATQAVSAAPLGLAVTISSAALASAATATTTLTVLEIISMSKIKVAIITAVVATGVAVPWVMQHRTQTRLAEVSETLHQRDTAFAQLSAENERLSNLVARTSVPIAPKTNDVPGELLRVRGELSRLKHETAAERATRTNGPSTMAGLTSDPAMFKLIRDQQKAGLGMIYKSFAKDANLPKEQGDKLADLLADNVMENIQKITEVLGAGKSPQETEQVLAAQETALLDKVKELLGPEDFAKYQDYTRNLASHITAEQFKDKFTGEKEEKDAKAKQLFELLQKESQQTLSSAGLSPDYQTVPTLNFRNFASDAAADKNLSLLDGIYERAAAKADSFLSPDEIAKFTEFRTTAIQVNRAALKVNRQMMSPSGSLAPK